MVFKINEVDITPYIAFGGLSWQRADVDGPNAGRDSTGTVIRDRRATKIRWDVTCRPLTNTEKSTVLQLIAPVSVTLQYTDPVTDTTKSDTFYSNNFPITFGIQRKNGVSLWTGLTFPLIQY